MMKSVKMRVSAIIMAAFVAIIPIGCAEQNAVINIDSGPPARATMGRPPVYSVHVGETVRMQFRPRFGSCDYAVLHDESSVRYEDCGPLIAGRFEWVHQFEKTPESSGLARIVITGYAQNGKRDKMPVNGALEEGRPSSDTADMVVGSATVLVQVYQSRVDIPVPAGDAKPDWKRTKFVLKRADGHQTRLGPDSKDIRGFKLTGPDAEGRQVVSYEPAEEEVNHSGETDAELTVADENGKTRMLSARIATP